MDIEYFVKIDCLRGYIGEKYVNGYFFSCDTFCVFFLVRMYNVAKFHEITCIGSQYAMFGQYLFMLWGFILSMPSVIRVTGF